MSARYNGRADHDANLANAREVPGNDIRLRVEMPTGAFERIAAEVAALDKRKPRQS
jgi:hypothetical protein